MKTFLRRSFYLIFFFASGWLAAFAQSNPQCQAKFSWKNTGSNTIQFANHSVPADGTMSWSFGDGGNSTDVNPKHSYAKPGKYRVCLSMYKKVDSSFCQSQWCDTVTVFDPCEVNFKAEPSAKNPLEVHFTDHSMGSPKHWMWSFGDDSTSSVQHPVHTYAKAGSYSVTLNAWGDTCSNGKTKFIKVGNASTDSGCKAHYKFEVSKANPREVQFTDHSTGGPVQWTWSFGDNSSSDKQHPAHTYAKAGTYTVCLVMSTPKCSDTICKTVVIKDSTTQAPCTATFTFKIRDNQSVDFLANQKQSPNVEYRWSFGDGYDGSGPNPHHVYAKPGKYTVCLQVTIREKSDSTIVLICDDKKCHDVLIEDNAGPCPTCSADFNFTIHKDREVKFNGMSGVSNASYSWRFGDGAKQSGKNPSHKYLNDGNYTVCLTVNQLKAAPNGDSCSVTVCKRVVFKGDSGNNASCSASFKASPVKGSNGFTFKFVPTGKNDSTSYSWDFGDGTNSTLKDPMHQFAKGTYLVCLMVANKNCKDKKCFELRVPDTVGGSTGIATPNNSDESFIIYPNPLGQDQLTLRAGDGQQSIKTVVVYNSIGKKVAEFPINGRSQEEHQLNFQQSQLLPGMYFFDILTDRGVVRKKLIVK